MKNYIYQIKKIIRKYFRAETKLVNKQEAQSMISIAITFTKESKLMYPTEHIIKSCHHKHDTK